MRDVGVVDIDAAESAVQRLKSLKGEFETTAASLKGCITNLKDLEETGGLAEQVIPIYEKQVTALEQVAQSFEQVINNLQADIDGARANVENMEKNALSGLI